MIDLVRIKEGRGRGFMGTLVILNENSQLERSRFGREGEEEGH